MSGRGIDWLLLILDDVASLLPGSLGIRLRHVYFARRLKHLGRRGTGGIHLGIEFVRPQNISIGNNFTALRNCRVVAEGGRIEMADDVSLASNVVIDAGVSGAISIGRGSGIAHNCVLRSSAHNYMDSARPFKTQGHKSGTIIIEDDVWVAANCVLLPGTHVERGAVVAAGSVVGGRVAAYSVVAGHPARVIARRG